MPLGRDGRLDPSQYRAVLQLGAGGDFLSVLTAPAGAGKTSTLGAAARAWQDAGHRVVGLAPSARAAAELATATGETTDTLAKWLHTHNSTTRGAQAKSALDGRTVVIVDEASMASTLDLDPLITAAARAGAKVVLVGDPAQIGVVNGPGGMLAALARAGHGVELADIHRFSHPWERQASLALRHGKADALAAYLTAGRLHPCPDGDAALDSVFAHWAAARADSQDALMLARTRVDVDALNQRARTVAVAAGEVTGPVTTAGGRDWQAGDVLRTRRNARRLTVGDGHVRNGDRYQVLGPGPQDGLIVEDLTGRGRTVLPASYLAEHAEYGWASTIGAAQGATADEGIVLVRPGMDREHLYVAMTRGRHGNHAYITPDATTDNDDHAHGQPHTRPPGAVGDPQEQAVRVLAAALGRSGAQDAAHTALEHARTLAAHTAREQQLAAKRAAARERVAAAAHPATTRRVHPGPPAARAVPGRTRAAAHRPRQAAPRPAADPPGARSGAPMGPQTEPTLATLDAEVDRLSRQADHHTRQRQASDLAAPHRPRPDRWDPTRSGAVARPRPTPLSGQDLSTLLAGREPYRGAEQDLGHGRSR